MNELVKILVNQCGEKDHNPKWHLVINEDTAKIVCTGEVFGDEEISMEFKIKHREKGITCPDCKDVVNWYKSIKL